MKTIAIKVSQNLGTNSHGAESHTAISLVKIFSEKYRVFVFGCEDYPDTLAEYIIPVKYRYMHLPKWLRKSLRKLKNIES